jgi:hypothetical protein
LQLTLPPLGAILFKYGKHDEEKQAASGIKESTISGMTENSSLQDTLE